MDVVDVIVGNKVIAENEPLVTAQAPDDLGIFQSLLPICPFLKHRDFYWLDK